MKFSIKLVLSTMIVLALALGFSGFYFVNYVFETSLEREVGQALDESSILSFAFETAALNVPLKYSVLPDSVVEEIASKLEMGGQSGGRLLRISDEEKNILYTSNGFTADEGLLVQTDQHTKSYQVIRAQNNFYVHTCVSINALNRILYLETMKDVTGVFTERALGFSLYRKVTVVMLLTGMVIMLFIASFLTKPIRLLTRATQNMASGDYAYRARQISRDELGQLTGDFNRMANALEENICKLEEEIEAREEFMGAFAHELKTPLTAISDMRTCCAPTIWMRKRASCRQTISTRRGNVWRRCLSAFSILLWQNRRRRRCRKRRWENCLSICGKCLRRKRSRKSVFRTRKPWCAWKRI